MSIGFIQKALVWSAFACMFQTTAIASDFPKLEDPQLQEFLNTIQNEHQKYLDSKDAYFALPTNSKAWPCKVSPIDLNLIAETLNSDDDPLQKRSAANVARSTRTVPIRNVFTNQKFYPIKAECKAGKLEGPLELWVEYDHATITSNVTIHYRMRKHVQLNVKGNKPIGQVLITATGDGSYEYTDPKIAAMMDKMPRSSDRSVYFMVRSANIPPLAQPANATLSLTTSDQVVTEALITTRPYNINRAEETTYGVFVPLTTRHKVIQYKDGKYHGIQTTYPFKSGATQMPLATICWEDGEKILTTNCSVD